MKTTRSDYMLAVLFAIIAAFLFWLGDYMTWQAEQANQTTISDVR